jgi:class 3 adenylate cyclase
MERRLAAILFTDVVGYNALMGRDEAAGRRVRARHEALVRAQVTPTVHPIGGLRRAPRSSEAHL